jgi:probable F420-dependent oxidoreductase
MQLGEYGVWTTNRAIGADHAGQAAKLLEDLGFGSFWLGSSPRLPELRPILEATERLVAATGIVNVWRYEPAQLATEHAELSPAFPDRVLVGIGIGHPEATTDYSHPLSTMRTFLDGLDAGDPPLPREERCLAALGPKMLDLAAERSRGVLSYFVPVEHTHFARERLGAGPLLAVELACVVTEDTERARNVARTYAQTYLRLRNYTSNLLRFGFSEDDIADGGSDRLIDAVIPHGSVGQIAEVVRAHRGAGADHVCLQPLDASGIPREAWTALAAELIG